MQAIESQMKRIWCFRFETTILHFKAILNFVMSHVPGVGSNSLQFFQAVGRYKWPYGTTSLTPVYLSGSCLFWNE